jgi:hypothetical protein
MALRLGIDMKLFDAAARASTDGSPVRIERLASETGADLLLVSKCRIRRRSPKQILTMIARIMRLLVGMGIFKEVAHGSFVSTPLASVYASPSPLPSAVVHMFVALSPTFIIVKVTIVPEHTSYRSSPGFQTTSKRTASRTQTTYITARFNTP